MNTKTLRKSTQKNKSAKTSPEQQFNEALARHQRFKKLNDKFEQEIRALIERVSPQIQPAEVEKYRQLYTLTQKLIPFFSKKSLPEYLREGLFEWINENISDLNRNPYSHLFDVAALLAEFDQHRGQHIDNHQEKHLKKLINQGVPEAEIEQLKDLNARAKEANTPEALAELLKELLDDDLENEEDDDINGLFDDLFDNDTTDFDDAFYNDDGAAQAQGSQQSLDRLFKASSINKLFRQIARAIHPDLERDETQKANKHQQMCLLIEARENKDIAYILQTYKTTFGKLPDIFPDQDYIQLTKIIKQMTERLSEQKEDILSATPFGHIYYEMFYFQKKHKEAAAIREHIKNQKETAQEYQAINAEIRNLSTLKDMLKAKMYFEALQFGEMEDDDFF